MVAIFLLIAGLGMYLVPKLVAQVQQLIVDMPGYIQSLAHHFNFDLSYITHWLQDAAQSPLQTGDDGQSVDYTSLAARVVSWLGVGIGVIGSTIGYVTYLGVAAVVVAFCFFFFLWKWPSITSWFVPFIPVKRRDHALEILRKMDASVYGFIRGRLIQSTVIAIVLSVGWSPLFADVPYFLLLGIGGGLLNLIPYAAVVAWPIAVLLAWLDSLSGGTVMVAVPPDALAAAHSAAAALMPGLAGPPAMGAMSVAAIPSVVQATPGFDLWGVLIWPSVIYFIAQGLDGWVVEPTVQGKATNLDPLTVLLAVLVGGSTAGLLGLLIAIPTAACVKILGQEVFLPTLRQWAAEGGQAPPEPAEQTRSQKQIQSAGSAHTTNSRPSSTTHPSSGE